VKRPAVEQQAGSRYWRNWAGTVTSVAVDMLEVTREADIVSAVQVARASALRVKAIGSGHSYNPIADVNGAIGLSLSSYAGIEHVDEITHYVTVKAGTQLGAFCTELAALRLALPVLGAITDQTIAGLLAPPPTALDGVCAASRIMWSGCALSTLVRMSSSCHWSAMRICHMPRN